MAPLLNVSPAGGLSVCLNAKAAEFHPIKDSQEHAPEPTDIYPEVEDAVSDVQHQHPVPAKQLSDALTEESESTAPAARVKQLDPRIAFLKSQFCMLENECKTRVKKLEELLGVEACQQSLCNALFLTAEELSSNQTDVQTVSQLITNVFQAVQTARMEESVPKVLQVMDEVTEKLGEQKALIQESMPEKQEIGPLVVFFNLISPIVVGTWWLLTKIGVFAASSPLAISLSFVGWAVALILNNRSSIENQIIDIRSRTKQTLITNCDSIISIYQQAKRKMDSIQIFKAADAATNSFAAAAANLQATKQLNEQLQAQRQEMKKTLDKQDQRISELAQESKETKVLIQQLLEAINKRA